MVSPGANYTLTDRFVFGCSRERDGQSRHKGDICTSASNSNLPCMLTKEVRGEGLVGVQAKASGVGGSAAGVTKGMED